MKFFAVVVEVNARLMIIIITILKNFWQEFLSNL